MSSPKILFLSYAHESDSHREWVLSLSERLRADGYETRLDQYVNGSPLERWPRWMLKQLNDADFVLVACTETYYRRFRGQEEESKGHGVDWEGEMIALEIYDARSRTLKFVPVLRVPADHAFIPEPLRGLTHYVLNSESTYHELCNFMDGVAGIEPRPVGQRAARTRPTGRALEFPNAHQVPCQLPPAAEKFFGRATQRQQLVERLKAGMHSTVVGLAGMGKTALAADALAEVVGLSGERLAESPFPDGVVFLDLYAHRGQAEPVWSALANTLKGGTFLEDKPAKQRAVEACRQQRLLVIIEGAEEADGHDGRTQLSELLSVLAPENRHLVLTRFRNQTLPAEWIQLDRLDDQEAEQLFDLLTIGIVQGAARTRVLELLAGHPLALTWAGNLLALENEDASVLANEWEADPTHNLNDPQQSEHTLHWLFNRSVRGLDEPARQVLAMAGLLGRAPFPVTAVEHVFNVLEKSRPGGAGDGHVGNVPHVRQALKQLIDRGLLRIVRDQEGYREFTHVLGYQFARNEESSDAALRQSLAEWLQQHLATSLSVGTEPAATLTDSLQHAAALLRTDHDQQLWLPLANFLLYDGRDRLVSLGMLDMVNAALSAVSVWLDRFPRKKAAEPFWLRERAEQLRLHADLNVSYGNLDSAHQEHTTAFNQFEWLAKSEPTNVKWQRDLSVSFNKLGDLATAQGNLPEAQRLFGESLRIAQRLAESAPANALWQYDVGISNERLGDVATAQSDHATARTHYSAKRIVIQRLAESEPSNAQWQRDLSVSFEKLGDLETARRNLREAQQFFDESLRIRQRLAESDPANAQGQRDLSISFEKLGNLETAQGNLPKAQQFFIESLRIRQRLIESEPANVEWQRDLSVSFNKLGDLATAQDNLPEAQQLFGESLRIRQRLAESDPANAVWQRDLWVSYSRFANALDQLESPNAKTYWKLARNKLSDMVSAGLFVSRQDMEFLERLRAEISD